MFSSASKVDNKENGYGTSLSSKKVEDLETRNIKSWVVRKDGDLEGVRLIGHEQVFTAVEVSRDGVRIVIGSHDQIVRVWNKVKGNWESVVLKGHGGLAGTIRVSWDGKRVVSASGDKVITTWNKSEAS